MREFRDEDGHPWHVWETHPTGSSEPVDGWLTFECFHARRRLAPVPHGWGSACEARLQQMCRVAEPVISEDELQEHIGRQGAVRWLEYQLAVPRSAPTPTHRSLTFVVRAPDAAR